ncbi:MAG: GNAT family N-acetyltransferase, partial [Candidatus Thorarchaeota archaeon]
MMKSNDNTNTREIRKLRPEEMDEFISLMELAFKDSIEEDRLDVDEVRRLMKKIRSPVYKVLTRTMGMRMEFYVAVVEDTIGSGIQLIIEKDEVHVGNLMTHPNFRRQGLARELLHLTFERARELGMEKVTLGARADNVNAVDLYKSEGFEVTYHVGRFEKDIE